MGPTPSPRMGPSGPKNGQKIFFQMFFFSAESCTLMSISSLTTIFYDVLAFFHEKIEFSAEVVYLAILLIICKKMHTEVPVLQDVEGQNRWHPPSTAQTPRSNWMKFLVEAPQENTFRGTEAIFDLLPLGRDLGVGSGTPRGPKMGKKFFPIFRFFSVDSANIRS